MWPFSSSTEPPVVERRIYLSATKRLVDPKKFKKAIKKAIPSVTEQELEALLTEYDLEGSFTLRVTKKAVKILRKYSDIFTVEHDKALQEIEEICNCNPNVCDGCIQMAKESMAYSKTNNGMIRDREDRTEFSGGSPIIRQQASGGPSHVRIW